jgi:hypothetical protein
MHLIYAEMTTVHWPAQPVPLGVQTARGTPDKSQTTQESVIRFMLASIHGDGAVMVINQNVSKAVLITASEITQLVVPHISSLMEICGYLKQLSPLVRPDSTPSLSTLTRPV